VKHHLPRSHRTGAGALAVLVAASFAPPAAEACTTFFTSDGDAVAVGKNYDWNLAQGMLVVNKRGVRKQALVLSRGDRPAEWTSRHASITFNQYGREFPNGGMNERGLVVEIMWLDSSVYPPPDQRPVINQLQWIQYQLDNHGSVQEMVERAQDLRVTLVHARVHYLACDRSGQCAAFEHIDGQMRVAHGAEMRARALTNSTYRESMSYLDRLGQALPQGRGSLERFARASRRAARAGERGQQSLRDYAFDILRDVAQGGYTKWSIVYEPRTLRVHFRTRENAAIRTVDFARFPRSCDTPIDVADIDEAGGGDITDRFVPYSRERNRALLERTLEPLLPLLPPGTLDAVAAYPDRLSCAARARRR
jgi:choloylglycine hydrolase